MLWYSEMKDVWLSTKPGREKPGQKKGKKTIKLLKNFIKYLLSISMETGATEKPTAEAVNIPSECS